MFVFQLVEKDFSEAFVANAAIRTGKQTVKKTTQQIKLVKPVKSTGNTVAKTVTKGKQVKKQLKKGVPQKKSYVEESVVKDASWNIYTGNPGFYVTQGDNLNFGTVTTLSDSAFLKAQHTIVPKTIKPYGIVGKELIIPNQDWVLGIILIFWVIFASVRVGFLKYLGQLFVSLVNLSATTRLYQQRGYKTMYGAVRLDFIFHLILPLSVYQIASFYKIDIPGYPAVLFFLALLLVINGYLFTKILLFRLAGSIVMLKEQTEESVFNIKLYYRALGLFLLPVVTVHAIIGKTNFITIWVMAGLIVIMYFAIVIRTIYLGNRKDVSFFYLILYLCTLEILPLLLVFKLISA
ncbi:MAG: DUF4271 domain-containing protein [Bacteroidia bacterium]|nr:DUF4271 domain-containing protein [Bacteroidia bacterium]